MNFEELGAMLREEREKRHLGLEDVANQLKINSRLLRAIEEGDVASLPHPAYVRGFIRSYARWLGLGNEEIQAALDGSGTGSARAVPKASPKVASKPVAQQADQNELYLPDPGQAAAKRSGGGIFAFLFLCALCGGAYYAWQNGAWEYIEGMFFDGHSHVKMEDKLQSADKYLAEKDREEARQAALHKPEPVTAPSPGEQERRLPMPGNNHETVIAPIPGQRLNPLDMAVPDKVPDETTEAASAESRPAANEEHSPQEATQMPPGQHRLVITAIEECWVHSNADRTDTRQFSLRKGDTFALAFSKSLELKLGNAGGVRIRYDGKEMPPPGTSGQVRTITFPPASQ